MLALPMLVAVAALAAQSAPATQAPAPAPERGVAPEGLVAPDARPMLVARGFGFTEGPAADERGLVHFTDLVRNEIHVLNAVDPVAAPEGRSGHTVFVVNSRGMNGLVFARDGRMLGCQGGAGALVEIDRASKAIRPLAERVMIDGVETKLGRINDLAVDAEGGIYFTDPSLGRTPSPSPGLHYRAPSGEVRRLDATVPGPNGVAIAPDGKSLVVLSYKDPGIYAFEIRAPGDLGPARKIGDLRTSDGAAPKGRGDGLAIDAEGRLWCTNPDAKQIQIFSPDGRFLGAVQFPEAPANCAFGGSDGRTLFVTAVTSLYALPTLVEGWWIARDAAKSAEPAGNR